MSAFADVFRKEMSASEAEIICIDGKAMRGTLYDNGRNPDIVSAYSLRSGFTLATDVCKEKSNEIKAVPRLLDKVNVSGCVVTADAMSFQKVIIDKIRDKGADFFFFFLHRRRYQPVPEFDFKFLACDDSYKISNYFKSIIHCMLSLSIILLYKYNT